VAVGFTSRLHLANMLARTYWHACCSHPPTPRTQRRRFHRRCRWQRKPQGPPPGWARATKRPCLRAPLPPAALPRRCVCPITRSPTTKVTVCAAARPIASACGLTEVDRSKPPPLPPSPHPLPLPCPCPGPALPLPCPCPCLVPALPRLSLRCVGAMGTRRAFRIIRTDHSASRCAVLFAHERAAAVSDAVANPRSFRHALLTPTGSGSVRSMW
jgi:hypothetical protein